MARHRLRTGRWHRRVRGRLADGLRPGAGRDHRLTGRAHRLSLATPASAIRARTSQIRVADDCRTSIDGGGGDTAGCDTAKLGGNLAGMLPNPAVTGLTIPGEARGDILYRGASAWLCLPAGTSGQFLRTGGAGADPSWATAGGNGNMLNLRDYEGLKVGDNWTPAMAQAIADFSAAVSAGDPCGGVYIPATRFPTGLRSLSACQSIRASTCAA